MNHLNLESKSILIGFAKAVYNSKPVEIKLHTQQRAVKRAIYNYSVATKLYLMQQQKKQVEKLQKIVVVEVKVDADGAGKKKKKRMNQGGGALTSNSTRDMRRPMEYGRVARYWKFWLTLRISRLIRFSRSSGRELRLLRRASKTRRLVKWEVELGRKRSLLELTESFFRLRSSNPMVSGSFVNWLKFAFSSSSDLYQGYAYFVKIHSEFSIK
ncbi:hypothetical protein RJ639_043605 [Escallonia herrerae]|uniref:TPX2 C-terminal domain-containing protein n=1 Tax=Escallonia herrerae TaxID=1293975 RepID=A0AA88WE97_9ASTE|nr:hypothetical protein RJ639_043605 [Escallonia herrerae]